MPKITDQQQHLLYELLAADKEAFSAMKVSLSALQEAVTQIQKAQGEQLVITKSTQESTGTFYKYAVFGLLMVILFLFGIIGSLLYHMNIQGAESILEGTSAASELLLKAR